MATLVETYLGERSFARPLGLRDLERSRNAYNALLDDTQQPQVADEHIKKLAALFVRHNAHTTLGVHLIHGHFQIPKNTLMLGKNFGNPCGRWTKPTDISTIDLDAVHGHIFVLKNNEFLAYEYQDGPMPDLSGVGQNFVAEFVHYITSNDLTDLLGLQVLMDGVDCDMWELILYNGTVMLDASKVQGCVPTRITGWKFEVRDGEPRTCAANETHAAMTSGNHKVFNAGKPEPKLDNIDELKKVLAGVGVLLNF